MILVNFKIYKEIFGEDGVTLAKIIKETADKFKVRIVITAPALEAVRIVEKTGAEVWLQHVDEFTNGKYSGWVSMEEAYKLGIKGSLLNHSEHRLPKGQVLKIIKSKPENFEIAVCVHSLGQINEWACKANPDWILYEPPELIASPDKSVASEKPDSIKKAAEYCKEVPLMVGAGVKSGEDVRISLRMGAKAVGLASGLVLSKEPERVLEEMVKPFLMV